jgi:glucose dehydrogenase
VLRTDRNSAAADDWAGKQFVVIAAGGHTRITEEAQSDELAAFALP